MSDRIFSVTENGFEALCNMTKNETIVIRGLMSALVDKGIVAHTTQKELAESVGLHINSLSRAINRLNEVGIVTTRGHGRVYVNPRSFFLGTLWESQQNAKEYDRIRAIRTEELRYKKARASRGFLKMEQ